MFIYNFKLNSNKFFKLIIAIIVVVVLIILGVVIYKVFSGASSNFFVSDSVDENAVNKIESKNYTNILKEVHDNIDDYVGKKINFTGYIYRVSDLKDNQFVLARNMIISSDYKYLVVGFLCEYEKAQELKDNNWVELTGEIYKGDYHGAMPIVKVTDIQQVNKPSEENVYPPDETYLPTSCVM